MKKTIAGILLTALLFTGVACAPHTPDEENDFTPSLNTEIDTTLSISGFMGNFEALDLVMDGFNEYYPNVKFSYDHNTAYRLPQYIENNEPDIFMTSAQNVNDAENTNFYVKDHCVDLYQKLNVSAVKSEALADVTVDGKLLSLPMAMTTYGMVVNKTLLAKEGVAIPSNYAQFVSAMDVLKEKGYTCLQGSSKTIYADLTVSMAMNTIAADSALKEALAQGDESAKEKIHPVFDRLSEMIEKGYTDHTLNESLPADNYNGSILSFFKGNVPFYVCNAECVSGMKKRESRSEEFTAAPFEYQFVYIPFGNNGAYAYSEPWYGFAVNKDGKQKDVALEFMRYMTTRLDDMSVSKGLPSVVKNSKNTLYAGITNASNIQATYSDNGEIPESIRNGYRQICTDFGAGVYSSAEEATAAFVELFSAVAAKI